MLICSGVFQDLAFLIDAGPKGPAPDGPLGGAEPKKSLEGDLDLSFLPDDLSSQEAANRSSAGTDAAGTASNG